MRVLNTTRAMTMKNARAKSASLERLKDKNMTSMVLYQSYDDNMLPNIYRITHNKIVLLYLKGRNTRSNRNVRRIEKRKNEVCRRHCIDGA